MKNSDLDIGYLKGCINVSDLNRIEGNNAFLAKAVGVESNYKKWNLQDLPFVEDRDRLLQTLSLLCEASHIEANIPQMLRSYNDFNAYEKTQLAIYIKLFIPLLTTDNVPLASTKIGNLLCVRKKAD